MFLFTNQHGACYDHLEKTTGKRYKSLHDIELKFDRASGGTTVKQILSSGITGSYSWYNASDGNMEESIQPSGAYVFIQTRAPVFLFLHLMNRHKLLCLMDICSKSVET